MARIAVVHVPYYSHIEALMRLTRVLLRQRHEIIAWAPEGWGEEAESEGVAFHEHQPEMPQTRGFMNFVAAMAGTTERAAGPLIEQLMAENVDLLIHDSQATWARVAGDYLGIPRIVSHPMFPIVAARRIPDEDEEEMDPDAEDDPEVRALFDARWLSIAGTWGVELGEVANVIHTAGVSDTTVAYTTEEIVGESNLADGWHCIGPLMEEAPPPPPPGDRPLVYVCLGTSFNTRRLVFKAVVDGLADEQVDVLISTGKGRISAAELGPLPDNVELRDFVPAREVLARARLHVTHGGCNSVHESLLAGVPMMLIPQAFDQFPLAQRIERLGAGLVVDETSAAIRTAARWLVQDEDVLACTRDLGRRLASYDGESRLAAVVARVLDESTALSA
jgi:demethyllactenocin mycarosyltransferase